MVINHKFSVLTTGLSGLVGSRIAYLLEKDFSFIDLSLDKGIDIANIDQIKEIFAKNKQVNEVIHLAAFTDVDAAWEQRGDKKGNCYQVNVVATENLARLCGQTGKFLIHFSTDFVFDGQKPPPGGYTEKDKPHPLEWYGQTKLLAEEKVKNSLEDYCLLRIAFPFKAKPEPKTLEPSVKQDLVRRMISNLKQDTLLSLFSDQIITPTFIDDIAKVVALCLKRKITGLYHCTGSSHLSPYQMAKRIASEFNFKKTVIKSISLENYLEKLAAETKGTPRPRQKQLPLSNKKLTKTFNVHMKTFPQALKTIKKQLG